MRLRTALIALACAAALLLFIPSVNAAQPDAPQELWKYMHPGARFIAGVDWIKVKNSPTGKMFAKQLASEGAKFKSSGPGLELFDQFERLLASGTEPSGANSQVIVAAEGRLDRAAFRKTMPAGTAVERFRGVDLYVPPKSKSDEMLLAIVNDRLALFGDRTSIARALDAPAAIADQALAARAAAMAAQADIWLVSASLGQKDSAASGGMKQLEDIESIDLGVTLQRGLGLRANLIAKSAESAQGLAMLVQLVSGMATQGQTQSPEIAAIVRSLQVHVEGPAVKLSMDVPLAQLERGVLQAKSSAQQAGRKTLESFLGIQPSGQIPPGLRPAVQAQAAAQPAAPAPPEPPRQRTIRIVGGDEGDREITYTSGGPRQ